MLAQKETELFQKTPENPSARLVQRVCVLVISFLFLKNLASLIFAMKSKTS